MASTTAVDPTPIAGERVLRTFDGMLQVLGVAAALAGTHQGLPLVGGVGAGVALIASGPQAWAGRNLLGAILGLMVCGVLAHAVDAATLPWQVPKTWPDLLKLTPLGAALIAAPYLAWALVTQRRPGPAASASAHLAWMACPLLFNVLLLLAAGPLVEALGRRLLGTEVSALVASLLARAALILACKEVLLFGLGWLLDRRGTWRWPLHLVLLAGSLLVAVSPLIANLADHPALAALPRLLQALAAIALSSAAQCGLWAEVFLVTGLLLDAIRGKRPTQRASIRHWRAGLTRGAIYAGLFMAMVLLISALSSFDLLVLALRSQPALVATLLGALSFPLLKTIVESFDGSAPFHLRLRTSLQERRHYLRGAIAGCGVGLAFAADLPAAASGARFLAGGLIGALGYAGADFAWNLAEINRGERTQLPSWRVYALGALLGAFVGGALAWYLDAAQIVAVREKFRAYAALNYGSAGLTARAYVVYPLFSKYGAIDLGLVAGGVKLLYAESLSGVINWSLAAPLFGINLILLTALFEKSMGPLRALFSPEGLANMVEQTVRVLRWGLWMAPVIYSFLRLAPDPTWYNQDGAVRTLVATVQSLLLSPTDFRAWSLGVFLGLLGYDALRVLIWFDHMGLRVATLVNLSFVGGDALDERAGRFLGHSARTRVVPESIRRFLTWAPLLIPFYIPRGAEWDQVWAQAEALATSSDPILPAVATLLIGYRVAAGLLALGVAGLIWRRLHRPPAVQTSGRPAPKVIGNGEYFLELHPDGRGYSRCESEERPGFILDLTRRPDDPMSLRGKFHYLSELDAAGAEVGPRWSLTEEPLRYGAVAITRPTPTSLRIVRSQSGLRIDAHIRIAASEPVETWDFEIHNSSDQPRVLELTSYQELGVGPVDAMRRTPAFAGLHVGTVFVRGLNAILARNRLMRTAGNTRMSREVAFHAVGGECELLGFQDARGDFLGLGTARAPEARMEPVEHEGLRYSFDPCASLCVRVELPSQGTRRLRFVDGYARDEQLAARRIARHLKKKIPDEDRLRALIEAPRVRAPHDDHALRDWAEPWSADGRALRVPTEARRPWTHVMANPQGHGAMVSGDGAIHAFAVNAQQNALTPACLESLPAQQPGELCLVLDLDSGEILSPCLVPLRRLSKDAQREAQFGLGWASFTQRAPDLELALEVYVDVDEPAQYRVLRIVNCGTQPRRLRVLSHFEIVLAEVGQDSAGRLQTEHASAASGIDVLLFCNPGNDFRRGWAFVASRLERPECVSRRSQVFGAARDATRPHLLLTGQADAQQADDGWRCASFCAQIELAPGETHESLSVLGQTQTREEALQLSARLCESDAARLALERVRAHWADRLGALRVRTANAGFDRLVNDWLPYQILVSRLWGRAGPAQRSGAFGFRDQLQDVLPLIALDPALARRQIMRHAAQQFREGDVLKWWHESWEGRTGIGVRTRASDPHLWLPYVVLRYVAATGDQAVLDESLPFIGGEPVPEGHEGRMIAARQSREHASLYEHCRRAVELTLAQRGETGLPLLGSGDWNDGLDMAGLHMHGESTWMAFFLHDVLRDFSLLAESRGQVTGASRYRAEAQRLRGAVETMWHRKVGGYVRATSDQGQELLYADALTASWAVLSGCVDLERGIEALERGCEKLEKTSRVLLMSPAFDEHSRPYPGRIAEYPPGVRENGGQYSHGSSWLIDAWLRCAELAEARPDAELAERCRARALELWLKISPLSKCTPEELPRYGLPPHQQPADVYEGPGYEGRGGWPWYTGAAARMLSAAYALLGLRLNPGQTPTRTNGPGTVQGDVQFHGHALPISPAPSTSRPIAERQNL